MAWSYRRIQLGAEIRMAGAACLAGCCELRRKGGHVAALRGIGELAGLGLEIGGIGLEAVDILPDGGQRVGLAGEIVRAGPCGEEGRRLGNIRLHLESPLLHVGHVAGFGIDHGIDRLHLGGDVLHRGAPRIDGALQVIRLRSTDQASETDIARRRQQDGGQRKGEPLACHSVSPSPVPGQDREVSLASASGAVKWPRRDVVRETRSCDRRVIFPRLRCCSRGAAYR